MALLGALGLALPASGRPRTVGIALVALAGAAGAALHHGAGPAAAPLWGAGLLAAGSLAERATTLPPAGQIDVAALVGWLAGIGTLAGAGLAAAAIVLLAAGTSLSSSIAGIAAGALLAIIPAALSRRVKAPRR